LESRAKQADERLDLADLRRATKVIARSLADLLVYPPAEGPGQTGQPGR
jgi:hypothetical protein